MTITATAVPTPIPTAAPAERPEFEAATAVEEEAGTPALGIEDTAAAEAPG